MIVEEKQLLRKKINAVRNGYQNDWLGEKSKIVSSYLVAWEHFKQAKKISGYLAYGSEVDIDDVLKLALAMGKEVFIPYIPNDDGYMRLVRLTSFADFLVGKYGIRTMKNPQVFTDFGDIDLVLAPGLAFTEQGSRLGMGKGYYDKFLTSTADAVKIGITLTPQVVGEIPLEPHDIMMDYLVTEEGIAKCGK